MAQIPPAPIASVLQSGVTQAETARVQDGAKNADAQRAKNLTSGPDAILEVEGTDTDDTQVHTDSGGLGSQGRYDPGPQDEGEEVLEDAADDITADDDAHHIDLSA